MKTDVFGLCKKKVTLGKVAWAGWCPGDASGGFSHRCQTRGQPRQHSVKNVVRVQDGPDIIIFVIYGVSHGISRRVGHAVSHGVSHGVSNRVSHGVSHEVGHGVSHRVGHGVGHRIGLAVGQIVGQELYRYRCRAPGRLTNENAE